MTHDEICLGGICDCDNPIPLSRPVTPHDELLIEVNRRLDVSYYNGDPQSMNALRAVVRLHSPFMGNTLELCKECMQLRKVDDPVVTYPCATIQAIERELA